jgi:predicted nucleic acid-binding protein
MSPCFADTFFFLALLNPRDKAHTRARAANRQDRPILTSEWVLLEVADHLCGINNRHLLARLRAELMADDRVEIFPMDQTILQRALELYSGRLDKEWSLTDCTSFILMRDRIITDAWTADHHFEQAGFRATLK